MTTDEANKIIAEFMGEWRAKFAPELKMDHANIPYEYSDSLDLLVPVWKKLLSHDLAFTPSMFCNPLGYYEFCVTPSTEDGDDERWDGCSGNSVLPSEAAAIATAKAIKELQK